MTWRTVAVALAAWGATGLGTANGPNIENTAASLVERRPVLPEPALATTAAPVREAGASDAPTSVSPTEVPTVEPVSTEPAPKPERTPAQPEPDLATAAAPVRVAAAGDSTPPEAVLSAAGAGATELLVDPVAKPPIETGMQLASAPTSAAVDKSLAPSVRSLEPSDRCVTDACIDAYLWSLYERTPKIDTNKTEERTKATVKKNGKTRTVTKTTTTYVTADFTWKDPAAAERSGMPVKDYVIGGMDPGFKLKLYGALRAMDDVGLMPGITSAFRDDYRQSIATGKKASDDSSYHGGSRRGGYGHGLAADLVSVKGDTRTERSASSDELWQWIDAHEKQLGIGRPYRDRDPPHVGPIDGTEYAVKRGVANERKHAVQAKKAARPRSETTRQLAVRTDSGATKHANPATSSKLSSLQKR